MIPRGTPPPADNRAAAAVPRAKKCKRKKHKRSASAAKKKKCKKKTALRLVRNQSFGRAILRWSSASSRIFSSTPISFATSRIERFEAAASLTISPALS